MRFMPVALCCAFVPALALAASPNAGGLPACTARNEALQSSVAACREGLDLCLSDLKACATAPVSAVSGGVAKSADGKAFVSIPPGALAKDASFRITPVSKPVVDAPRASAVYEFGPSQTFAAPVQVCLSGSVDNKGKGCLGYLDEKTSPPQWKCEDACLTEPSSGLYCGKTDHFTSFAILLSGSGSNDTCQSDDVINSVTGGVAVSSDGGAFVSLSPAALVRSSAITVKRVGTPVVEAKRASDVYDVSPGQKLAASATVCLKAPQASPEGNCLGYIDETTNPPRWKCQDACLEKKGDYLCGETDHFTNFALLLTGSEGSSNKCSQK